MDTENIKGQQLDATNLKDGEPPALPDSMETGGADSNYSSPAASDLHLGDSSEGGG